MDKKISYNIKFEISSLMKWILAGYTGSKNPVHQTGEFKKWSADRQEVWIRIGIANIKEKNWAKLSHWLNFFTPSRKQWDQFKYFQDLQNSLSTFYDNNEKTIKSFQIFQQKINTCGANLVFLFCMKKSVIHR